MIRYSEKMTTHDIENEVSKLTKEEAIKILGFNPSSNEYKTMMIELDPLKACIILRFFNKDNRNFYKTQLKKIDNSISENGFRQNGEAMSFNVDGNLTEWQHRLDRVFYNLLTVKVPVVLGVDRESFSKVAEPKKRSAIDQIYRRDKTATKEDETALRQIVNRRGVEKLSLPNALTMWDKYKTHVRHARKVVKLLVKNKDNYFNSWKKELLGVAGLMSYIGNGDDVKNLFEILANHKLRNDTTLLSRDFFDFVTNETGSAFETTNAEKSRGKFALLCRACDRIMKKSDGEIELGFTQRNNTDTYMRAKSTGSVYRKFLEDPDGIVKKGSGFKSAA